MGRECLAVSPVGNYSRPSCKRKFSVPISYLCYWFSLFNPSNDVDAGCADDMPSRLHSHVAALRFSRQSKEDAADRRWGEIYFSAFLEADLSRGVGLNVFRPSQAFSAEYVLQNS